MPPMNPKVFRLSVILSGTVAGFVLYLWTADSRTVASLALHVAMGTLMGFLLEKFFVLPGEEDEGAGGDEDEEPDPEEARSDGRTNRPGAAVFLFAAAGVLVLLQAARTFYLAGNWADVPGLVAGLSWAGAVSAGLACWWLFRRRALGSVTASERANYPAGEEGTHGLLGSLVGSWMGALVGIAVAGALAKFTGAGLLMTLSLLVATLCLAATFPRKVWWS